jgi:hypothetical protein
VAYANPGNNTFPLGASLLAKAAVHPASISMQEATMWIAQFQCHKHNLAKGQHCLMPVIRS